MDSLLRIKPVETEAEWEAARAVRQRVFVEEQRCPPEEEWDEHDETSRHLLGLAGGEPVATARWRRVSYGGREAAKLERFAVYPEHRGRGYGRQMVARAMEEARRAGLSLLILHAQAHLESFYAGFGFHPVGPRFEEAGIPHVKMVLEDGERGSGAAGKP